MNVKKQKQDQKLAYKKHTTNTQRYREEHETEEKQLLIKSVMRKFRPSLRTFHLSSLLWSATVS